MLISMDMQMSVMDGVATRQTPLFAKYGNVPIIVMTANLVEVDLP